MVLAELEQENYNLARKMENMKKQWENEIEKNVQTKLKLEESKTKRADLKHKCDAFFSQVEGLHLQLQQSEEDNGDLRIKLRDRETRIQTLTDSAARNLSAAMEQIEVLRQQVAVYAEDFAKERSDRERIEAEAEEENRALGEQAAMNLSTATEENEVLRHQIEADRERLVDLEEEIVALRQQARRALRIGQPVVLPAHEEMPAVLE
ncbi:Hypothetical predicted protein [Paramuricea clavata]|uniref:NF-kappa-B essential modulator NEMO CC2-LZ domain-containing protein n=1 Tax=Paramuricea clavata TaxID=317549 RepID=A0A7D9EVQ5_PARCT|nr:Hypothetical predicted protein [Paramuricea clavata]